MTWVAVAAAVVGAGASYLGSKKQAGAATKGANMQMDQFNTLNRQQQPYIQSGYGAQAKLNTLLGLGGGPSGYGGGAPMPSSQMQPQPANPGYRPTPGGGVQPIAQLGPQPSGMQAQGMQPQGQNMELRRILALRAAHGDTQAQQMLGNV
jgi:hypothetical protein